ncbi:hypothetical protein Dthio_PD1304 [Desulfonatronospira thiodismutans ASO3-1]|uniref:Uncharacterized protein n=1 Tax=Desulfonatronospira thiodismutans ASO3-1 TaxID=555779 RepID=D6STE9_9BACT|nr:MULTISPECIES: hypothetical protein [Desulfonatronospira]EFI33965.1 hypothetical protein Dthio_PD1304 [Desulfonatronospira thiodismutans ASO3-1]RQD75238.1 MAG: hypothetical protein D5S03_08695 [Desulfonatronospira sp. MSAO_Bac3]
MDAWDLLIYLMIFLAAVVGTALAYARMLDWKKRNIKLLEQRLAETQKHYNELTKEVGDLKLKKNRLRSELQDRKKVQDMNSETRQKEQEHDQEWAEDQLPESLSYLLNKGIVEHKHIEKARQYLEKGDNAGLAVEDAMVLLGFVQPEDLRKAKKKVQKD